MAVEKKEIISEVLKVLIKICRYKKLQSQLIRKEVPFYKLEISIGYTLFMACCI